MRRRIASVDGGVVRVTGRRSSTATAPRGTRGPRTTTSPPPRLALDTPEGWLAVTGGELVSLRTEARRTRAEYRLGPAGQVRHRDRGAAHATSGMRQEGEQSVRGYAHARARGADARPRCVARAQEMLAFYAERFGPSPYPTLGLVLAEGETPGGHSPPGLVYLQKRPPVLRGHARRTTPRTSATCPASSSPTRLAHQWWGQGTAPANYRERWLSEAWAQYAAALWVRERARRGGVPRHDGPHGGLGAARRRRRPDPPRPAARATSRATRGSSARSSTTRARGCSTCCAASWATRPSSTARARFLEEHRFAKAGTEDLRRGAREGERPRPAPATSTRWIYDTGLPVVALDAAHSAAAGTGFVTTSRSARRPCPARCRCEIAVAGAAGREVRAVVLEPAGGSFTIETRAEPAARVAQRRPRPARPHRARVETAGAGPQR